MNNFMEKLDDVSIKFGLTEKEKLELFKRALDQAYYASLELPNQVELWTAESIAEAYKKTKALSLSILAEQIHSNQVAKKESKKSEFRNRVFISYSHRDAQWVERIVEQLKGQFNTIMNDELIDLWDDTRIRAGTHWRDEIKQALDSTKVALLLVSPSFLASNFVANEELPRLLEKAARDGTVVIPVIISPTAFSPIPSLSRFQSVKSATGALSTLTWTEQEKELLKVAKATIAAIESK